MCLLPYLCHVATNADHVSIEDYHAAINADHAAIEHCHVAINADHVAIDACHVVINADHVSIEDYHVAINADHVAIDACHVVINAGQTHHIFSAQASLVLIQFVFLRVGLTAAMRTYWIPSREQIMSNASYWKTVWQSTLDAQCLKEALRKAPHDSSYCTHT